MATDGQKISGLQPFKGLIENMSPSSYSMYWQVDGGSQVQMNDDSADYPHKESLVDVGGWNWNDGGPYHLTFTAKDGSGNVIATKNVGVYVAH